MSAACSTVLAHQRQQSEPHQTPADPQCSSADASPACPRQPSSSQLKAHIAAPWDSWYDQRHRLLPSVVCIPTGQAQHLVKAPPPALCGARCQGQQFSTCRAATCQIGLASTAAGSASCRPLVLSGECGLDWRQRVAAGACMSHMLTQPVSRVCLAQLSTAAPDGLMPWRCRVEGGCFIRTSCAV